jgi:hypothetical protein
MKAVKEFCGKGNDILATYIGESDLYTSSRLMVIEGKQDARPGTVGTLVSPQQAKGVIIDSGIPDVKTFSFTWQGELRQLVVKIRSKGGVIPSSCTVKLLKPRANGKRWKTLSGDVALVGQAVDANGDPVPLLFNPHALAEWGDVIYLIDYESRMIVILGADELEGMAGNYTPLKAPFSFGSATTILPDDARGQALITLGDNLYALYLVANLAGTQHAPGVLCRLTIGSNGTLSYDTRAFVGKNAQAIIPVSDGNAIQLLVPAIGGVQKNTGESNFEDTNVCCVPAEGDWDYDDEKAPVLITGDPAPEPPPGTKKDTPTVTGTYNILALGAGTRGPSNKLYILTQVYLLNTDGTWDAVWRIYDITVGQFLSYRDLSSPPTLGTAAGLHTTDEGVVDVVDLGGVYFWDLLYCQTVEISDAGDLLWAGLGTPILVTRAAEGGYGSPTASRENAFVVFGCNGGNNVNAIDLPVEATNEAKRGGVSLKRGLNGSTFTGSSDSDK